MDDELHQHVDRLKVRRVYVPLADDFVILFVRSGEFVWLCRRLFEMAMTVIRKKLSSDSLLDLST